MKWKEIFFFNKKDKIAVLILTCVGIILSSSYLVYPHLRSTSKSDLSLNEFAEFQKNLKPIYSANKISEEHTPTTQRSKNKSKLIAGQNIDLNTANETALKKVPGIGDTFAKRIVEYRSLLGGFCSIEQLMEVKGISEKKFGKIKFYFSLEKQPQKQSLEKLMRLNHPYLNEKQITSISSYTNNGNKITSFETLQSLEHFAPRDINRIKDYVYLK